MPDPAEDGAGVQDVGVRLRQQVRQQQPREVHRGLQVDGERQVDLLGGLLLEERQVTDPGVVDQDVDASAPVPGMGTERGPLFRQRQVGGEAVQPVPVPGEAGCPRAGRVRGVDVHQQHLGTLREQFGGHGAADATGSPGQQDSGGL